MYTLQIYIWYGTTLQFSMSVNLKYSQLQEALIIYMFLKHTLQYLCMCVFVYVPCFNCWEI